MPEAFTIDKYGHTYIAHRAGCDCLADEAVHGEAEHPVSALRQLLKKEEAASAAQTSCPECRRPAGAGHKMDCSRQ